ncbi:MAG: flavodoxin domain-containing protein [Ktedonobacteraceae bacterium]
MNTFVVYDSTFGNTKQVAEAIANALREYGSVEVVSVEHTHPLALEGVDVLILGCPTQGWRPTQAMRDLLEYIPTESLQRLNIACFDTRFDRSAMVTGSAAKLMARKLSKRGALHLLPTESFFVEGTHGPLKSGELEQAANWANLIHESVSADLIAAQ